MVNDKTLFPTNVVYTTHDLFLVETSWCPYQLFHRTFTIDLTASIVSCQSCVVYTTFVGNSVLSFTTSELNYFSFCPALAALRFVSLSTKTAKTSAMSLDQRRLVHTENKSNNTPTITVTTTTTTTTTATTTTTTTTTTTATTITTATTTMRAAT